MIDIDEVTGGVSPPCYAVIFTSQWAEPHEGYEPMSERMVQLAGEQSGSLGVESAREGASRITVSDGVSEGAIASWRAYMEHLAAPEKGPTISYKSDRLQVAKVERCSEGCIR